METIVCGPSFASVGFEFGRFARVELGWWCLVAHCPDQSDRTGTRREHTIEFGSGCMIDCTNNPTYGKIDLLLKIQYSSGYMFILCQHLTWVWAFFLKAEKYCIKHTYSKMIVQTTVRTYRLYFFKMQHRFFSTYQFLSQVIAAFLEATCTSSPCYDPR